MPDYGGIRGEKKGNWEQKTAGSLGLGFGCWVEGIFAKVSYYLWGQSKAPAPAEIADEKFIRPTSADTTVQIDAQEYMDQIARPNFELGEVGIFKTFFSYKTRYQKKMRNQGWKKFPRKKLRFRIWKISLKPVKTNQKLMGKSML